MSAPPAPAPLRVQRCFVDFEIHNHTPYAIQLAQLVTAQSDPAVAPGDPYSFWANTEPIDINPIISPKSNFSFRINRRHCLLNTTFRYEDPYYDVERFRLATNFGSGSTAVTPPVPYPSGGYPCATDLAPWESCTRNYQLGLSKCDQSLTTSPSVFNGLSSVVIDSSNANNPVNLQKLANLLAQVNALGNQVPGTNSSIFTTTQYGYFWFDLKRTLNAQILRIDVYLKDILDADTVAVSTGVRPFAGIKICVRETDIGGPSCVPLGPGGTQTCGSACQGRYGTGLPFVSFDKNPNSNNPNNRPPSS